MRRVVPLLACLGLGLPAAAQRAFETTDSVYLPEGIMRGSPRVFGIAGAFAGIAEGADGFMHNPAALSNRLPPFDHDLNFDVSGIFHMLPNSALSSQDWDNDGRADQTISNSGMFGTILAGFALAVQYKRFGIGLGFDAQGFNYCYPEGVCLDSGNATDRKTDVGVAFGHFFAAASFAFFNDDLLVGAGVETTNMGLFTIERPRLESPACSIRTEADDCFSYSGLGVFAGMLLRPNRANWRFGAALKPPTVAYPDVKVFGVAPGDRQPLGGLVLPATAYAPARLSLGFSFRIASEGDVPYNVYKGDYSKGPDGEVKGSELPPALPSRKLLVTTEVTVILPTFGGSTVSLQGFFHQRDPQGGGAEVIGTRVMFLPRLAFEGDPIAERLRLRLGSYLEPSSFAGGPWRPHLTLGAEVALFTLWQRWSIGLSIDVGDNLFGYGASGGDPRPGRPSYFNLSVAILVWK